jgi:hypothetical protein
VVSETSWWNGCLLLAEGVLTRVAVGLSVLAHFIAGACDIRNVQETILVLVFLVDAAHERGGGRQDLVDEDEDGLLGAELDALADYIDELTDSQIGGHEVLLLVDGGNVRLLDLLADDLAQC